MRNMQLYFNLSSRLLSFVPLNFQGTITLLVTNWFCWTGTQNVPPPPPPQKFSQTSACFCRLQHHSFSALMLHRKNKNMLSPSFKITIHCYFRIHPSLTLFFSPCHLSLCFLRIMSSSSLAPALSCLEKAENSKKEGIARNQERIAKKSHCHLRKDSL